jgi:microcystin-dependent protein
MANYEATKYDFSGANLTGIEGIPTATIVPWSDSSVPTGFLECNGAAVSRSTYSALFAIVGTTYGAGDGASTFNLPDLQDNVPLGKSGTKALASTGGTETAATANATLSTAQLASHSHGFNQRASHSNVNRLNLNYGNDGRYQNSVNTTNTGSGTGHQHNTSTLQPYIALIYIIKT